MALRIVAGGQIRGCDGARGRASPPARRVSTYSAMIASSTWRSALDRGRASGDHGAILPLEQLDEQGVGQKEAGLGEPRAAVALCEQPALAPRRRAAASRRAAARAPRARRATPRGRRRPCGGPRMSRSARRWRGGQRLVASSTGSAPASSVRAVALDRLHVAVAHVAEEAAGAGAAAPGIPRRASRCWLWRERKPGRA